MGHYAHAENEVKDKFKIALGSYKLIQSNATLSLTDPDLGIGGSIDPKDTLGLQSEQSVLRIDGYYRFNNKNAIIYSWYRIASDGGKSIEEEINWIDENGNPITIPIGARVNTRLQYDIYKLGYLWSFYHTDKVELAAGGGLHITRISVALETETTSSGIGASDVAVTVPLPVLSFGLTYHVTPKFSWLLKTEIFGLKYGEWDGTYTDATAAVEYRAFKNVGLGIGFGTNSLRITEKTGDYDFVFGNQISGLTIYVAAYF